MLQPGTTLDKKYQIEATLGRGGYGYVYRAREQLTGEVVAIKELIPGLVGDVQSVQRFIQEARATRRLTHAHIARTFGVFQDGETYYLAMEYLPGGSLANRLERGPLPMGEALRITDELCSALDYAHRQGVVHCDLKPANVLLDARGGVHLADFGIAHVSEALMTRQLMTGTGMVMGTMRYMAPEQLEGVRTDPRVDLYALGAILYEMLAGRPYLDFESDTTPAAQMRNMQRIQSEPPRSLRQLNASVPPRLDAVVERALRKAPGERFPTARALQEALRAVSGLPAAAPPQLQPQPPEPRPRPQIAPQAQPAPTRRRLAPGQYVLIAVIAILGLGLVLSGGVLLVRSLRTEPTPGLALSPGFTGTALLGGPSSSPTTTPAAPTATPTAVTRASDTPTPLPSATETPSPLPAATDTPLPSPEPPTATTIPTPSHADKEKALLGRVRWRPQNGPAAFAYYADPPPVFDGVLDTQTEWLGTAYAIDNVVNKPENWSGLQDLSGRFYLSWDTGYLYLGLEILDDLHVQASSGALLYKGDDVEIQVDANLAKDWASKTLSADDAQVGLAVRDLLTGLYDAYIWLPKGREGRPQVEMAARPFDGGYVLEAAIPWKALSVSPKAETPYGFCLSLGDNDTPGSVQQQTMVSSSPTRKFGDPTAWGTMVLVDW